MSTCAPFARAPASDISVPGTLMRSPKVHSVQPFSSASQTASSIYPTGVTHTGQPGPEMSRMFSGSRLRMPSRKISCVCVPQTSMMRIGGPS